MPSKKRPHPATPRPRPEPKSSSATQLLTPPRRQAPAPAPFPAPESEWLETDGIGGFASGTVSGIRTRRTHALLLVSTPRGPVVLVNGLDARVATPQGAFDITSHRYTPDVIYPEGNRRLESFTTDPWPAWVYRLDDGTRIEQQLFSVSGASGVILTWRVVDSPANGVHLMVRPLLSGREARALHYENPHFRTDAIVCDSAVEWHPYDSVPAVLAGSNGRYAHVPFWYRNFLYEEDRARGLEHVEDLNSPGAFHYDLSRGEAVLFLTTREGLRAMQSTAAAHTSGVPGFVGPSRGDPEGALDALREGERASRIALASPLHRAADAYLLRRADSVGLASGYPWMRDASRETFAAVRGLCVATDRLELAERILEGWVPTLSQGMFPVEFPAEGRTPEYETVDAPLWFVIAAHELLREAEETRTHLSTAARNALQHAIATIMSAYAEGTRFRIRMDEDGLLAAGEPGKWLTWMDAAFPERAPRIGKPVEVQALWLNAARIAAEIDPHWGDVYERGRASFERRFWNEPAGSLHDIVDAGHARGTVDSAFRANQILAVGGLPFPILEGKRARQVVDLVEAKLLTPHGLRAGPADEGSISRVAWPWLYGPFVEAWARVRGDRPEVRKEARERFLDPLLTQLSRGGLGHLPEAVDVDPPHEERGAPFYAWSVGEAIRLDARLGAR